MIIDSFHKPDYDSFVRFIFHHEFNIVYECLL
jgi:hypothetical protein